MEIWPPGHFSPIHNHGNAFGIVRMLHGSLTGEHLQRSSFHLALPLVQWVQCKVLVPCLVQLARGGCMLLEGRRKVSSSIQ